MKKLTKKYWIKFSNCEVDMTDAIQITAEQYWKQMKKIEEVIEKTKDDENCGQAHKHSLKPIDKEKSILYVDYLMFGTADVILYREECKEGYQFVSRRNK